MHENTINMANKLANAQFMQQELNSNQPTAFMRKLRLEDI